MIFAADTHAFGSDLLRRSGRDKFDKRDFNPADDNFPGAGDHFDRLCGDCNHRLSQDDWCIADLGRTLHGHVVTSDDAGVCASCERSASDNDVSPDQIRHSEDTEKFCVQPRGIDPGSQIHGGRRHNFAVQRHRVHGVDHHSSGTTTGQNLPVQGHAPAQQMHQSFRLNQRRCGSRVGLGDNEVFGGTQIDFSARGPGANRGIR